MSGSGDGPRRGNGKAGRAQANIQQRLGYYPVTSTVEVVGMTKRTPFRVRNLDTPQTPLGHVLMWGAFFAAGFALAAGLQVGLPDWVAKDPGGIMAGLGGLAAAIVALYLGRSQDRRLEAQRASQAAAVATYLMPRVQLVAISVEPIAAWSDMDRFSWSLDASFLEKETSALMSFDSIPGLHEQMMSLHVLPGALGAELLSIEASFRLLQELLRRAIVAVSERQPDTDARLLKISERAGEVHYRLKMAYRSLFRASVTPRISTIRARQGALDARRQQPNGPTG